MGSFKLKRRTILKGLGGAMLGLPVLEAMTPSRAEAQATPQRFVLIYGGMSIAAGQQTDLPIPNTVGPNYDLKRGMLPLGNGALQGVPGLMGNGFDVTQHTSIVSNLLIPYAEAGQPAPPAGKNNEFHYNTVGPQISGMSCGDTRQEAPNGPSVDQIIADAIAGNTPHHSLSYRVQAASYVGSNSTGGDSGRISWRDNAGNLEAVDPVFSPELAYSTLFGNFIPPDPALAAAAERRNTRHKSVIDLVRTHTQRLIPKLGAEDKIRMERHLAEIESLESRLASIPPIGGACYLPTDPGADPTVEGAAIEYPEGSGIGGDGAGYSNEELRAETLFDMINMAFACDQSRVAAVRMTWSQSHMQVADLLNQQGDLHELGHNNNEEGYGDALAWHVKHFARLLDKMRNTQELDGSTLLDNTVVVLLFEGGIGYDPEDDPPDPNSVDPHSTENMIALVGGHAGGLNPNGGKHIVTQQMHPANVCISAMNAVGVREATEDLGQVTGKIGELFT